MYCKKCGKQVRGGNFCPYCGEIINSGDGINNYKNPLNSVNKRRPWGILCLGIVLLLVVGGVARCLTKSAEEQSQIGERSIVGMYEGEYRGWLLWMYEDGTLYMDDSDGTYEQIADNSWIMSVNDHAFKLKGTLTEDGNLYVTSDHPNWDSEMFYKLEDGQASHVEEFDLEDVIDVSWVELDKAMPKESYDKLKFRDKEETGDEAYHYIDDKGTRIRGWEREGEHEVQVHDVRISAYETNYCIHGVYIGQDYEEAKKILEQNNMEMYEEREWDGRLDEEWWDVNFIGEGNFDMISIWNFKDDNNIYKGVSIMERKGKVLYVQMDS